MLNAKRLLYLILVLLFSTLYEAQTLSVIPAPEEPKGMTLHQFDRRIKKAKKPLLVYFSADWCVICKRQRPILEQILAENKNNVELLIIDMATNPAVADYFDVKALPVNLLYVNGYLVWDRVGFQEKEKIMNYVNVFLKKPELLAPGH